MTTLAEVILRDTRGNQPAASAVAPGTIYYVTDENVTERSTGSSWEDISDGGSGGGDITTDGEWAAKGDLIVGTGENTAAILSVGANGSYPRAASGESTGMEWQKNNLAATAAPDADNDTDEGYTVGSAWFDTTNDEVYFCVDNTDGAAVWKQVASGGGGSGLTTDTSFPGGPSTGDRLRRSDLDYLVFFYDGTRWVSQQIFQTELAFTYTSAIGSSTTPWMQPRWTGYDLWVVKISASIFSGSSHNGSNHWTLGLQSQAGAAAGVDVGSPIDTDGHAGSNTWQDFEQSIGAAVTDAAADIFKCNMVKIASGPNIIPIFSAYYRLIAT